jgi:hypothetical protein
MPLTFTPGYFHVHDQHAVSASGILRREQLSALSMAGVMKNCELGAAKPDFIAFLQSLVDFYRL